MASDEAATIEAYNEMRAALPPDYVRQLEAHANGVIAQYQAKGDAGVTALMYICIKAAAMQSQGLL